jgi:hypothetical protein
VRGGDSTHLVKYDFIELGGEGISSKCAGARFEEMSKGQQRSSN